MRNIFVVEYADHADSAVSLTDKIHDQDIVVVGMGLTVLAVRIGRMDENVVVPSAFLYHSGATEFVNTSLDRVDDFHVFGMGVFRLQHDERFPKGGGNLDLVAVHCPTSSGSMPISASMPAGISSGSSPESSSIKPYSWASARSIAMRTSSE